MHTDQINSISLWRFSKHGMCSTSFSSVPYTLWFKNLLCNNLLVPVGKSKINDIVKEISLVWIRVWRDSSYTCALVCYFKASRQTTQATENIINKHPSLPLSVHLSLSLSLSLSPSPSRANLFLQKVVTAVIFPGVIFNRKRHLRITCYVH